jgi:hypothetical protein
MLLVEPQAGRTLDTAAFVTVPPDSHREHASLIGFYDRLGAAAWREAVGHPRLEFFPVRTEAVMERFAATALMRLDHRYVAIGGSTPVAEVDLYQWLLGRQPWSHALTTFLDGQEWAQPLDSLYDLK